MVYDDCVLGVLGSLPSKHNRRSPKDHCESKGLAEVLSFIELENIGQF